MPLEDSVATMTEDMPDDLFRLRDWAKARAQQVNDLQIQLDEARYARKSAEDGLDIVAKERDKLQIEINRLKAIINDAA